MKGNGKKKNRKKNVPNVYHHPPPITNRQNQPDSNEPRANISGQENTTMLTESNKRFKIKWSTQNITAVISVILNTLVLLTALWAIRQTNKALTNFNAQNTPFLQAGGFKTNGDTLYYTISNMGVYPAKIIEVKTSRILFDFTEAVFDERLSEGKKIRMILADSVSGNRDITDSFENAIQAAGDSILYHKSEYTYVTKEISSAFRYDHFHKPDSISQLLFPNFYCEVIYVNELNGNMRRYYCSAFIYGDSNSPQVRFTRNINQDWNKTWSEKEIFNRSWER